MIKIERCYLIQNYNIKRSLMEIKILRLKLNKQIHKGHTIFALMLMIGAVFCGTPYPKVFDGSNGYIIYKALDYHATAGIVLGG